MWAMQEGKEQTKALYDAGVDYIAEKFARALL